MELKKDMTTINVDCEASANYDDRNKEMPNVITLTRERDDSEDLDKKMWFNLLLNSGQDDDYITLTFFIEDLLSAIGKVLRDG